MLYTKSEIQIFCRCENNCYFRVWPHGLMYPNVDVLASVAQLLLTWGVPACMPTQESYMYMHVDSGVPTCTCMLIQEFLHVHACCFRTCYMYTYMHADSGVPTCTCMLTQELLHVHACRLAQELLHVHACRLRSCYMYMHADSGNNLRLPPLVL